MDEKKKGGIVNDRFVEDKEMIMNPDLWPQVILFMKRWRKAGEIVMNCVTHKTYTSEIPEMETGVLMKLDIMEKRYRVWFILMGVTPTDGEIPYQEFDTVEDMLKAEWVVD